MKNEEEARRKLQEQLRITEELHGLAPGSLDAGEAKKESESKSDLDTPTRVVEVRYVEKKQSPLLVLVNAAITVAILLWVVSWLTSGFGSSTTPKPLSSESRAALYPTGTDGQFYFTVNSMQCGFSAIGDAKAKGQFCVVKFSVMNTGASAATFFDNSQFAFDKSGRKYTADAWAGIQSDSPTTETLNPGLSADVISIFDVPLDSPPITVEAHDGSLSGGVLLSIPNS